MPVRRPSPKSRDRRDEGVVGVVAAEPAEGEPGAVGDVVEDGVAGDLEGLVEGDRAVAARLEVAERRGCRSGSSTRTRRCGSSELPAATAAGTLSALSVEAGAIAEPVTRESSGVPAFGEVRAAYSLAEMPPVHTLGS